MIYLGIVCARLPVNTCSYGVCTVCFRDAFVSFTSQFLTTLFSYRLLYMLLYELSKASLLGYSSMDRSKDTYFTFDIPHSCYTDGYFGSSVLDSLQFVPFYVESSMQTYT